MKLNIPKQAHIVIGLSGGVDSTVAAYLLKEQGYRVSAAFMQNWRDDDADCPATQDFADARAVAAQLNIPLHYVNFSEDYWQRVFQHFLDEYAAGRTPNPDILCNREIKFRAFLDYAQNELQADYIATGHYARIGQDKDQVQLQKAIDSNKDQTYFLHALTQAQLSKACFPIGHLTKPEVRAIAIQQNFINCRKKDSTGICFIGERKFRDFLAQYLLAQPGPIETVDGNIIGQHQGLMYYTIGQRQGIGIGGLKKHGEAAWYVVEKAVKRNALLVAQGADHPALFASVLYCLTPHWINPLNPNLALHCKIRYRQAEQTCKLSAYNEKYWRIDFVTPQRAITPGQSIVFYQGDICLGGAIIVGIRCE